MSDLAREAITHGDAWKLRDIPYLMRPNKNRPYTSCGNPRRCSDHVNSSPVPTYSESVIAGNKVFTAIDTDGFLLRHSALPMFITWAKRCRRET